MNIRFARVVALVAALAMLSLAACSTEDREGAAVGPSGAAQGGTPSAEMSGVTVTVKNRSFSQDQLSIAPGTTVTWVNEDEQGHTITNGTDGTPAEAPLFDEELNAGETVSYTFDTEGTFDVTCKIHPDMQMTVVVQAGS